MEPSGISFRTLLASLLLLGTAGLAACGSDADTSPGSPETDAPAGARLCDAPKADNKPKVFVPAEPATQLRIVDDKVGTGEAVGPPCTKALRTYPVEIRDGQVMLSDATLSAELKA